MLRFVLLFAGSAAALFAVYQATEVTNRFRHVNEANAAICCGFLDLVGIPCTRSGTSLQMATGGMEIISECSAVYVAILFTAGVLAFPTTWRARLRGLGFGLPTIFVVNQLRLVTLGIVIRYRAALLPLFHEYLWQVFFIFLTAALYLLWIEHFVPRQREVRAT